MAVYTSTSTVGQPPNPAALPPTNTTTPPIDPLLLQPAVNNILALQAQQQELNAAATGTQLSATGAQAEANAYSTAAQIASTTAATEAIAESVREIQLNREVQQTVGGIKASVAANGFQMGGSALDIMKSSLRQGALATQLSALTSEQTQAGYMEQAAAATGEMQAANAQVMAAQSLAASQTAASQAAAAQQAALTGALTQLISGDPNASKLVSDLTSGNTTNLSSDLLLYGQANSSTPGGPVGGVPSAGSSSSPSREIDYSKPPVAGAATFGLDNPDLSSINAGTKMIAPGVYAPVINPMTGAAFSGYLPT